MQNKTVKNVHNLLLSTAEEIILLVKNPSYAKMLCNENKLFQIEKRIVIINVHYFD